MEHITSLSPYVYADVLISHIFRLTYARNRGLSLAINKRKIKCLRNIIIGTI